MPQLARTKSSLKKSLRERRYALGAATVWLLGILLSLGNGTMLLKLNVDLTSCDPGNSCYQACYSDEKKPPIMYAVFL